MWDDIMSDEQAYWDPEDFPSRTYKEYFSASKDAVTTSRSSGSVASSSLIQQFRDYAGRNPTSAEIAKAAGMSTAQIKSYLKSVSKSSSGGSKSTGGSSSGSSSGGGDSSSLESLDSQYTRLSRYSDLTKLKDPSTLGMDRVSQDAIKSLDEQFKSTISDMGASVDKLSAANAPLVAGKIPDSVAAQVRQIAAESTSGAGIFGPGARAVTARDLGTTAIDIMQRGFTNEATINSIRESQAKMVEASSEFRRTYNVRVNEMLNVLRSTDLDEAKLDQVQKQFNATMKFNIMGSILNAAKARAQYTSMLAIHDVDSSGVASDFNGLISEMEGLLSGGGGYYV